MQENKNRKDVFTIMERPPLADGTKQKGVFVKIGIGFINHDGSINLKLNALPVNGTLHVRDYESDEERQRRFGGPRGASAPTQPVGLG